VAENSYRLGAGMGLRQLPLRNLRWSAYLHDIGKNLVAMMLEGAGFDVG
jgi:HD-GYP domain-containing protein (c-di-GMP phosphodiesterase class II)